MYSLCVKQQNAILQCQKVENFIVTLLGTFFVFRKQKQNTILQCQSVNLVAPVT